MKINITINLTGEMKKKYDRMAKSNGITIEQYVIDLINAKLDEAVNMPKIKNPIQTLSLTAVYEKSEGWYIGSIKEVPGALTQGKTLKECKENLKEALGMILDYHKEKNHLNNAIIERINMAEV
jgi:predicted RNase H-like HicB family nuclease